MKQELRLTKGKI